MIDIAEMNICISNTVVEFDLSEKLLRKTFTEEEEC